MDTDPQAALPNIPAVILAAKACYADVLALLAHWAELLAAIKNEQAAPTPTPAPTPGPAIVTACPEPEQIAAALMAAAADDATSEAGAWDGSRIKGLIALFTTLAPLIPQLAPLIAVFEGLFKTTPPTPAK